MLHTWYFSCYDINREWEQNPLVAIQLAQDTNIHAQRCDTISITYLRSKLCLDTDQLSYNISCLK